MLHALLLYLEIKLRQYCEPLIFVDIHTSHPNILPELKVILVLVARKLVSLELTYMR